MSESVSMNGGNSMEQRSGRVVVALSGGVDSSVAAGLLVEDGYEVVGMMLRLWNEPGRADSNRCCTPDSMAAARRVCATLAIPFYVVDVREVFRKIVVSGFIAGYAKGITPNPCLECNRHIRWQLLLERALALEAGYLATGHYARLARGRDGHFLLLRAIDEAKDQSYVLHTLNQSQLARALFPLGEHRKSSVREMARRLGLMVHDRPESQDLCFLAGDDYRKFLKRNAPEILTPGQITNSAGEILGEHRGLANYTIGQRKGLGISTPNPLYVIAKDMKNNTLIVGRFDELGKDTMIVEEINWINGPPADYSFRALAQIRYTATPQAALITPMQNNRAGVRFDHMVRDITPGQAAVFYDGEVCLGGGIITSAMNSTEEGPHGLGRLTTICANTIR